MDTMILSSFWFHEAEQAVLTKASELFRRISTSHNHEGAWEALNTSPVSF